MVYGTPAAPQTTTLHRKRQQKKKVARARSPVEWDQLHQQDFIMRNFRNFQSVYTDHSERNHWSGHFNYITSLENPPPGDITQGVFPFLGTSGYQAYIDLPSHVLSSLVPYARVYKVDPKQGSKAEVTEMVMAANIGEDLNTFSVAKSVDQILTDEASRGVGGGITSIDITMAGANVASAKKMFEIKMEYYFASMKDLFRKRKDGAGNQYTFADLISKQASPTAANSPAEACDNAKKVRQGKASGSGNASKIVLEYGFQELDKNIQPYPDATKSKVARKIIQETQKVMYLNLFKHKVDFKENGSLTVTAEYHGYAEESGNKIDIFSAMAKYDPNNGVNKLNEIVDLEYDLCRARSAKRTSSSPSANPATKESEYDKRHRQQIEKKQEKLAKLRTKVYTGFIDTLVQRGKLHTINIKEKDLVTEKAETSNGYFKSGVVPKPIPDDPDFADALRKSFEDERAAGGGEVDPRGFWEWMGNSFGPSIEGRITWFYLGDIVDYIAELCSEVDSDIHIVLGSFMHFDGERNTYGGKQGFTLLPLARFPISAQAFGDWWFHHVLQKGERTSYYLMDFLRDVLAGLVKGCYEIRTFGQDDRANQVNIQNLTFQVAQFISPEKLATGRHSYRNCARNSGLVTKKFDYGNCGDIETGTRHFDTKTNRRQINGNCNILLWGSPPPFMDDGLKGRRQNQFMFIADKYPPDANRGIWTLKSGTTSGIIKKIKFSHSDAKFGAETRMVNNGMSSLEASMWGFYNANVEMYGCQAFYPGSFVRITSAEFEQEEADKIGLGGYYRILKVMHKIRQGSYITEIECQWEAKTSTGAGA